MKVGDATAEIEIKALRNAQPPRPVAVPEAPVPVAGRQASAAQPVEVPRMESVTRQIDSFLRSINRSLQFRVDEATGRILVDGLDIESIRLASLRANIGLVSQEVVLFNDTIAANIAYGGKIAASEAEIIAAARAAHAWANRPAGRPRRIVS